MTSDQFAHTHNIATKKLYLVINCLSWTCS